MDPTLHPPSKGRPELWIVLVLVAAGLCIYGQTLGYPFINFDDPGYVVTNPHVTHGLTWEGWRWAWTSFERSNWHPLTWLSLMLDAQFYGLNAGGYHLTNLLLHLADALLLFWWLRSATGAVWPSAWTALFFVVHPLHVESVAWVTERKDVLSTLFFCLTLLAYTRYARGGGRWFYALSLALFALGLCAKPMLVTLPALLLLLDFWPLHRREGWRWLVLEKLPFFLLVAASCAVTFAAQHSLAVVPLDVLPVPFRLASAMLGYGFYLRKTFWPLDLGIYYPYWHARWIVYPWAWGFALVLATAGAARCARRLPWVFVGWCWFLGTLVPVIGVVQVGGQAVADRYAYVPHIGLFIALFWTGAAAVRRWPRTRPWLTGAAAAAVAGCLALSWQQARYWHSSATLFEHTMTIVRPTGRLYHLLGDAYVEDHRPADAERAYRLAWAAGSHDYLNATTLSGVMLQRGAWEEVAALLGPLANDPQTASDGVLNNLASALAKQGRRDEAIAVYRRCVNLHPDYSLAHFGLGELLQEQGNITDAAAEYEAGLTTRDDWQPALTRLALLYALEPGNDTLHQRALTLARRAVNLSGGRDLGSLSALAAAAASVADWKEAVNTTQAALDLARQPGAPRGAADLCRERLQAYRQERMPSP